MQVNGHILIRLLSHRGAANVNRIDGFGRVFSVISM